jgi:hypothetical protein
MREQLDDGGVDDESLDLRMARRSRWHAEAEVEAGLRNFTETLT